MVMKEPGLKLVVPSLELRIARLPLWICGCVFEVAGVMEITLKPERVSAYTVPSDETTI